MQMRQLFLFFFFSIVIFPGCLQKKHSLKDKRIVITAPEIYAKRLQKALEEYDAEIVAMPAIETIVYDSLIGWQDKHQTVLPSADLVKSYDFIVLPSRNAIKAFDNDMRRRPGNSCFKDGPFYVLGSDREYLEELGYNTSVEAPDPSMMGILTCIKAIGGYRDKKLLLVAPMVSIIDEPNVVPQFIEETEQMGIDCHKVFGYTTRPVMNKHTQQVLADVSKGKFDMMAFSSGGELFAVAQMCNVSGLDCKIACFGPYTASNAGEVGIKVDMVSNEHHSFDDFAYSIAKFFD